jgi:hypothetical protein
MTIFRLCFRALLCDKQLIRHSSSQRQLVNLPRFELSTRRYFGGRALLVHWLIAQAKVGRVVEAVSGPTTVDVWTSKEFLLVVVILIGSLRQFLLIMTVISDEASEIQFNSINNTEHCGSSTATRITNTCSCSSSPFMTSCVQHPLGVFGYQWQRKRSPAVSTVFAFCCCH